MHMQPFQLVYLCWSQAQMNDYVREVWCEVSAKSNVKKLYFHLEQLKVFCLHVLLIENCIFRAPNLKMIVVQLKVFTTGFRILAFKQQYDRCYTNTASPFDIQSKPQLQM